MSCFRWLCVGLPAALLIASTAQARLQVVSWSYVEPCSVDAFELRYGDSANSLDTVVDVGRPRQAGGHFSYELDLPNGQETWVCVAAIRDGATSDCSNTIRIAATSEDDLRSEPAPDQAARTWCDDFTGGSRRAGWVPTGPGESLDIQPGLFVAASTGDGSAAFLSSQEVDDIHDHFLGVDDDGTDAADWSTYEYSGQMLFTDDEGGVGVTLYSLYRSARSYYRLGRHPGSGSFRVERDHTDPSWKCINVQPAVPVEADTWYVFRVRAAPSADALRTIIDAKVWPSTEREPEGFQVTCTDAAPGRQVAGAIGLWSAGGGTKAWDSLHVSTLTEDDGPVGAPGKPELVAY